MTPCSILIAEDLLHKFKVAFRIPKCSVLTHSALFPSTTMYFSSQSKTASLCSTFFWNATLHTLSTGSQIHWCWVTKWGLARRVIGWWCRARCPPKILRLEWKWEGPRLWAWTLYRWNNRVWQHRRYRASHILLAVCPWNQSHPFTFMTLKKHVNVGYGI